MISIISVSIHIDFENLEIIINRIRNLELKLIEN